MRSKSQAAVEKNFLSTREKNKLKEARDRARHYRQNRKTINSSVKVESSAKK